MVIKLNIHILLKFVRSRMYCIDRNGSLDRLLSISDACSKLVVINTAPPSKHLSPTS